MLGNILTIYTGSDGVATKGLYDLLDQRGPKGELAHHLMRAMKTSERAKQYRGRDGQGRKYSQLSYGRKQDAIEKVAALLGQHAQRFGILWGWAEDTDQPYHRWILYVDLPTGQVSFHAAERGDGPTYTKPWDQKKRQGSIRICKFAAAVLEMEDAAA
jgi:hypothetical protein